MQRLILVHAAYTTDTRLHKGCTQCQHARHHAFEESGAMCTFASKKCTRMHRMYMQFMDDANDVHKIHTMACAHIENLMFLEHV